MKKILNVARYFVCLILAILWAKNPSGNYEPKIVVIGCFALLLPEIIGLFKGRNKYDPAKVDKILKIYDSIKEFLGTIQGAGSPDQKERFKLIKGTKYVEVIFGNDMIEKYIKELHQKGLDLEFIEREIQKATTSQRRELLIQKSRNLFLWFCNQHKVVDEMFKPYLNN